MTADANQLVDKLWNFCHVLRHDGLSTIDYIDQLTLLLFLKMAEENDRRILPDGCRWADLAPLRGTALVEKYTAILRTLATHNGAVGAVFASAQNRIRTAAALRRLVDLIGAQDWSRAGYDLHGDAYEALLEKGAEDVKSGAGQYFTPRALVAAIVDCVRPTPDDTIVDPACGTGGFLLAAKSAVDGTHRAIRGVELVEATARLAQMNLLLHGIGTPDGAPLVTVDDALRTPPTPDERATVVLANPPFGRRSAAGPGDARYHRADFWATTANKQLNFLQHIATLLHPERQRPGLANRAAVVVPDNVLFEGGAGETIRRALLRDYDVHTLLRLPAGIFYAGGVKANVLFFDRGGSRTTTLWVYDFRTDRHFTLRRNRLTRAALQDFVDCYRSERRESAVFRPFTYDELIARDKANLDITWAPRRTDDGEPPEAIAERIADDLRAALGEFSAVTEALRAAAPQRDSSGAG